MDDAQFAALLAHAYRLPSERVEQPGLVDDVLSRIQRRRVMRGVVLMLATLVGLGVAIAAFALTGVAGKVAGELASLRPASVEPSVWWVVGFVLILSAAVRNAIRDL
jgi:hypothetical protein